MVPRRNVTRISKHQWPTKKDLLCLARISLKIGRTRGVLVSLKFYWASHIVEFVFGRFSHFNIAVAYSNSQFYGAWTPSFCEFTWNFSKTSELQWTYVRSGKPSLFVYFSKKWPPLNLLHLCLVCICLNYVFYFICTIFWLVMLIPCKLNTFKKCKHGTSMEIPVEASADVVNIEN